jgi:hypothetical protein
MRCIPQRKSHPLKGEIRRLELAYWQVRFLLGGHPSEATLSRYLNGVEPIPKDIEEKLEEVVAGVSGEKENQTY